jgi:hypothetical protein
MDELMALNLFTMSLPAALFAMSLFGGLVVLPALRCGIDPLKCRPEPEHHANRH